ncbi:MAG: TlpA disulfide reductase family protein [Betaproteobacteria bacterium]
MKFVLAAITFWVALAQPALAKTPGEVDIGQTLGDATMQGLNGPSRKLSAFRGKPLIINFWASWCGPCREEMASLERLAWRGEASQFVVIGVSTDDYPELAKSLLQKTHARLNHFIDKQLQLERMLGAERLPLTVLVDARGRVLDKVYGAMEWDSPQSLALIRKAFAPTKPTTR